MTSDLEQYLQTDYPRHKSTIDEIYSLTAEALPQFVSAFDKAGACWPYELVHLQRPERQNKFSFSTTAMIAFALSLMTGRVRDSVLVPAIRNALEVTSNDNRIPGLIDRALARLVQESDRLGSRNLTTSTTFGPDDPFTLTWIVEVARNSSSNKEFRAKALKFGNRLVKRVVRNPDGPILQLEQGTQVSNTFPLLRVLQLGESMSRAKRGSGVSQFIDIGTTREFLEDRIHRRLSESEIPESGFDAADLVFSLEGWILTSRDEPNPSVVERVLQVIGRSQETIPYWRPLRPIKSTPTGLVLLPQSIEMANSLLRICAMPSLASRNYFSSHIDLLERYRRWLVGRTFRGAFVARGGRTPFVGWESEHTYTLNGIHLWETSQALIFLRHYAAMMQNHLATTSLRLAALMPTHVPSPREYAERATRWNKWREGEPFTSPSKSSVYRVYRQIDTDFVEPRVPGTSSPSYSMLLYGPPGTGKSLIASKLADALGLSMIVVTPSDFLSSGGEAVEARAKAIFEVLEEQTNLLVLFDEIDNLLLDRESDLYRQQGDVFKLLTPGMLTKLSKLAESKRVVFVVATNYYERIDRAIKRPGRIDARYLVLPPDLNRRRTILKEAAAGIRSAGIERLAKATVRFTFRELKDFVEYVKRRSPAARGPVLLAAMERAVRVTRPMITLTAYRARLGIEGDGPEFRLDSESEGEEGPWEEFALLVYLEIEATGRLPSEPKWLPFAIREALRRRVLVDQVIADSLESSLKVSRGLKR
jgi:hypothetical protein